MERWIGSKTDVAPMEEDRPLVIKQPAYDPGPPKPIRREGQRPQEQPLSPPPEELERPIEGLNEIEKARVAQFALTIVSNVPESDGMEEQGSSEHSDPQDGEEQAADYSK